MRRTSRAWRGARWEALFTTFVVALAGCVEAPDRTAASVTEGEDATAGDDVATGTVSAPDATVEDAADVGVEPADTTSGAGDAVVDASLDEDADAGDVALPDAGEDAFWYDAGPGVDTATLGCAGCHGEAGEPAPPRDLRGETDPSAVGVGAHRSHLGASRWHADLKCTACHVVPMSNDAPGHDDTALPAEVDFSGLATLGGASPSWNGATCAGTYCHGATLPEGGYEPLWTRVGRLEGACGTCHGVPPKQGHVRRFDCVACHPNIAENWSFTDPSTHLDGIVEVTGEACSTCHGGPDSAAPPTDLLGDTLTSARGVGAHQSHLAASDWRAPIVCAECHRVPSLVSDPGHIDSALPAELAWGELATSGGATPSWTGASCGGTYCHGSTLREGGFEPVWTVVGESQAACGTCHGVPPTAPHPQNPDCASCHPTIDADLRFPDPTRHIDGVVDLALDAGCASCHGGPANAAPPRATSGATATTARGVGAHQSHLAASTWHAPVQCQSCHVVPQSLEDPGHADTALPAEVTFGAQARLHDASPSWGGASCTGVYCHGATLAEGGATPTWTRVGEGMAACGTCHGAPPAAPHPASSACSVCHSSIAADGTFPDPARHIDGVLDVSPMSCTSCHGDAASPAPPRDVAGDTATSARGVGAHRSHVGTSTWHAQVACHDCHVVPDEVGDAGHLDVARPADVTFSDLAVTDGATPSWSGASCTGAYCHGATLVDGGASPVWTSVGTGQAACGTCHGLPPAAPHTALTDCSACHGAVVAADDRTFVDPSRHIDGVVQSAPVHPAGWAAASAHGAVFNDQTGTAGCVACHGADLRGGPSGVSCDGCHAAKSTHWQSDCVFCHGGGDNATGAPPLGVDGESARGVAAVGAHTPHVQQTSLHTAWDCARCHPARGDIWSAGHIDGDGRAEVSFTAPNASGTYTASSATCASSYCHGNGRGANGSAVWTNDPPQLGCKSCHQDATNITSGGMSGAHYKHVKDKGLKCVVCHAGTVDAANVITGLASHVDGDADVQLQSGTWTASTKRCTPTCHGNEYWYD